MAQKQKKKAFNLHFQMWDQYLTRLNSIWDLESPKNSVKDEETHREQPVTHFHTSLWDQHLGTLNQNWQITPPQSLTPPTSWGGKCLFPLKRLLLKWMQPVFNDIVLQQNAVTAQVVQTCNAIVDTVNEQAIQKLQAQRDFNSRVVQTLNGLVDLLSANADVKELETMIWAYSRHQEALEIEQIRLNHTLEHALSIVREQGDPSSLPSQERQNDYTYLLFENRYRGDESVIQQRFHAYLPYFQECRNVLDVGCGRGEFLELIQQHDIQGYGIDTNHSMIASCRQKGLHVEETDVLEHLQTVPDNTLDGIFSAQLIEHLSPQQLQQFLQRCFAKLQHHKYLVLETQNPQSLYALSHFYRDISHEKPVHPDALQFLLNAAGFQDIHVEYQVPFAPEKALQEIDVTAIPDEHVRNQLTTVNDNIRQLNDMMYGHLDYAIIARKVNIF